jgi:hypothetical protein
LYISLSSTRTYTGCTFANRTIIYTGKMEEELLREMIRDRDIQTELIHKKMIEQSKKMISSAEHLKQTAAALKTSRVEQALELDQLVKRHSQRVEQLKSATESMDMKKQQQGSSLHVYTEVMKAVATPESMDSSYVMRMQAQLCKAMHSMGVAENQLSLVTRQTEYWMKYLKDSVTSTVDDKSQVELKLMNDLVVADNARREAEATMKAKMEDYHKEREALEKRGRKKTDDDEDESEEADDDDEERDELMEILNQGREEITRMEEENKKQLAKMNELKDKILAMGLEVPVVKLVEKKKEEESDGDEEDDEEEEE